MPRKDEAYQYIKNCIITNQLKPNQPISELTIADELHMSRSPIREAFRELEAEGLIVSYPSRGSFVSSLTPSDVEEIYELRVLLETWALERGFTRISDSKIDELEERFKDAEKDGDWGKKHFADRLFHGTIVEAAGSKRVLDFVNCLNSQIERIRRISATDPRRAELSYQEHMTILKCMRERNLEKAKKALEVHLKAVADSTLQGAKFLGI